MVAFLVAVVPSAGVLLVFWIAIRALVQADRRERVAQARIEAAERLAGIPGSAAHSPAPAAPTSGGQVPPAAAGAPQ